MTNIESAIEAIESVNLETDEASDQLHSIITTRLKRLPIFLTDLNIGEYLVRARYLTEDEDFHHYIQDYSYHPKPEFIRLLRANLPSQQVFYASRFRVTALAEMRLVTANRENKFARYSLGRWDVRQKLNLAAIITPKSIRDNKSVELYHLADFIDQKGIELSNDGEMKGFIDLYKYLSNKFREPVLEGEENKYKITAAFSNFIHSMRPGEADGILYQSVQYPEHFNIAIQRTAIDDGKLQLTNAWRQKFERIEGLHYKEIESIQALNIDYQSSKITWP